MHAPERRGEYCRLRTTPTRGRRGVAVTQSITRVWTAIDFLLSVIPCIDSIVVASPPARQAELLDTVDKGLLRIRVITLLTTSNREPPLEADDTKLWGIGNSGGTLLEEDYHWTWAGEDCLQLRMTHSEDVARKGKEVALTSARHEGSWKVPGREIMASPILAA